MTKIISMIFISFLFLCSSVKSEILERSDTYNGNTGEYFYPKTSIPKGWIHSPKESAYSSTFAIVPESGDKVSINISARKKSDTPNQYTLKLYIDESLSHYSNPNYGYKITERNKITTLKGLPLRSTYTESYSNNDFTLNAYHEEEDYYICFSINSTSEVLLKKYEHEFQKLVESYAPPDLSSEDLAKEAAAENYINSISTESIVSALEKLNSTAPNEFKKIDFKVFFKYYNVNVYKNILKRGIIKFFTAEEIKNFAYLSGNINSSESSFQKRIIAYANYIAPDLYQQYQDATRNMETIEPILQTTH